MKKTTNQRKYSHKKRVSEAKRLADICHDALLKYFQTTYLYNAKKIEHKGSIASIKLDNNLIVISHNTEAVTSSIVADPMDFDRLSKAIKSVTHFEYRNLLG